MPPRTSQEQFDRQASHYNAQWNQWSEKSLRWLVEHARVEKSHRVLDVATGTGFTALAFAPLAAEVVGVDVSEGMLAKAREHAAGIGNIRFEVAAAEALPFPDESFDRVTCRVAPHHFGSVPKFIAEARRVLRPGGRLLVADTSVPDDLPELDAWQNRVELLRDPSHVRNYSPREWRGFVENAGFTVEELGTAEEAKPLTLRSWLEKAGCQGDAANQVRLMFEHSPAAAREAFRIRDVAGDTAFHWIRVVLAAVKAS